MLVAVFLTVFTAHFTACFSKTWRFKAFIIAIEIVY